MLTDYDIRLKLINNLRNTNKRRPYRIIEELVICDGQARADVSIANGVLHGYEIKSDCDTLERLPNQVKCYDKTFDKNTIVIGKKFLDNINEFVPEHWGIDVAYLNRFENVSIKHIRTCRFNKLISADNLLDLVWSQEIKQFFRIKKIHGYSNKDKNALKKLAMEKIPFNDLRNFTRETLKIRADWR